MKLSLKLARVGMNMQEATVVKWHRQPGENFSKGEALYDIETEKVTQEVEAPGAGSMLEILVPAGQQAQVGQAVCLVDLDLSAGG